MSDLYIMVNNQMNKMKEKIISKFIELDISVFNNDLELSKILNPEITKYNQ